jgi:pyrimidine and pyridine-specific 5'-nucleotidase
MSDINHPDPGLSQQDEKIVMFFDIDNCLYPRSARVHDLMADLIDQYFSERLGLSMEEAIRLHKEYYLGYGLALQGLVRNHKIDPLDYNVKVDDALPLDDILKPDAELKKLLEDIDRERVTVWLFTNAYVTHARRVVRLLGLDDTLVDGITFCDYAQEILVCKPNEQMYAKAMREAGVEQNSRCYFVDDSYTNCQQAQKLGWTTAHLVEEGLQAPKTPASKYQISHLRELRDVFPQIFKQDAA